MMKNSQEWVPGQGGHGRRIRPFYRFYEPRGQMQEMVKGISQEFFKENGPQAGHYPHRNAHERPAEMAGPAITLRGDAAFDQP